MSSEKLTQLQQAVIEHDDDMARLDRNTMPTPETPITVESCLAELREMFPTYKYFAVEVAEGAPRSKYKLIIGPSYYSSDIQFWNDETLGACLDKVRAWKDRND